MGVQVNVGNFIMVLLENSLWISLQYTLQFSTTLQSYGVNFIALAVGKQEEGE